ncbi:hypothetical protein [Aurantiacibacter zhengii]|uniref:hypothetical protein n=1 Tax=Aurantiacibacter zhengii TaxID=2307003 RepID=UPI0018F42B9A|nr:hypothetical protein [Aurantiacibacter zhengii]
MSARTFNVPCRIAVEQSEYHFHAHVELADEIAIEPGDRVRVHGAPIAVAFGETAVFERMATVTRANALQRAWTRLVAYFDFKELYEVSFNPGRVR